VKTEAQKRASKNYRAKHTALTVMLTDNHADILEWLERPEVLEEGKAAYVRRLIREDMKRGGK
jgi:hypothetical protein